MVSSRGRAHDNAVFREPRECRNARPHFSGRAFYSTHEGHAVVPVASMGGSILLLRPMIRRGRCHLRRAVSPYRRDSGLQRSSPDSAARMCLRIDPHFPDDVSVPVRFLPDVRYGTNSLAVRRAGSRMVRSGRSHCGRHGGDAATIAPSAAVRRRSAVGPFE